MKTGLVLDVVAWAAVISAEVSEQLGAAEPLANIPVAQRRRLPPFARDALRCTLPLLRDQPGCPVVFSSPHGDLASTVTLLTDVAHRQILSPSLFGLSVHNAASGALSLCLDAPGDQIALAGDAASLAAGFTEAYARLATSEATSILLYHAEERLPSCYAEFDNDAPGVCVAMMLRLADDSPRETFAIRPSRAGAVALAHALAGGATRVTSAPPRLLSLAA